MSEVPKTKTADAKANGNYLRQLDGLRFFAFLSVLVHHLPSFSSNYWLATLHDKGWVGVEFFFVISAYLFFYLLEKECDRKGSISIRNFYLRRFLRIFPLMVIFCIFMMIYFNRFGPEVLLRFSGVVLGIDNFVTWMKGYNGAVPYAAHLWTLSFELQVYLVIPGAFLVYKTIGRRAFLLTLLGVWVYLFIARQIAFAAGATHPTIWVSPLLQPESVLAGIALSISRPRWYPAISGIMFLIFAYMFFVVLPQPWASIYGNVVTYPVAALMCCSLVDFALRSRIAGSVLSWPLLRALGTISFGLYVFRMFAMLFPKRWMTGYFVGQDISKDAVFYVALFFSTLLATIAMAVISYWVIERPFLRLKLRFTAVDGRS